MCTFCVHCGTCCGKGPALVQPGQCPACGAQNDPTASACQQCGTPLMAMSAGASAQKAG